MVYDKACVFDEAEVFDRAWVYGEAMVFGEAQVSDEAEVSGEARIFDKAGVSGKATVSDKAWVFGKATVCTSAYILSQDDYIVFQNVGSENGVLTAYRGKDGNICCNRGCFSGSIDEFEEAVKDTHGDSKIGREYRAIIAAIRIRFEEK